MLKAKTRNQKRPPPFVSRRTGVRPRAAQPDGAVGARGARGRGRSAAPAALDLVLLPIHLVAVLPNTARLGAAAAAGTARRAARVRTRCGPVPVIVEKSGNIFRGGVFLNFVRLTTRAPHGGASHVRRAKRNRIDRRSRVDSPSLVHLSSPAHWIMPLRLTVKLHAGPLTPETQWRQTDPVCQ